MSYHDRLDMEINEELDALLAVGQKWVPQWIAHKICQNHRGGLADDGEDREFWEHGGYLHTRKRVTQVINTRSGDNPSHRTNQQLILHGFERDRLQDYYVVVRNNDEIAVPIIGGDAITDDELNEKAALYRSMGSACYEHADEIERFRDWRRQQRMAI